MTKYDFSREGKEKFLEDVKVKKEGILNNLKNAKMFMNSSLIDKYSKDYRKCEVNEIKYENDRKNYINGLVELIDMGRKCYELVKGDGSSSNNENGLGELLVKIEEKSESLSKISVNYESDLIKYIAWTNSINKIDSKI